MEKIRVAQIITRMDWGGSPDLVRLICSHLDKERFEVTLICGATDYPSRKTSEFLSGFGKVVFMPELRRDVDFVSDLRALIRLYSYFRGKKFDIAHTHTAKAGALGRFAAFLAGVPVIIHTPHGHNLYGYFGRIFTWWITAVERVSAVWTSKILALTLLEKNDYLKYGIGKENSIEVVNTAVETDNYQRDSAARLQLRDAFHVPIGQSVVGMVGRLEKVKGPDIFVAAAKKVLSVRADVKFILFGDGSMRKELEDDVHSCGLEGRIVFAGWRDDIQQVMSMLDILVLPSRNEAVGLVLIEAQACGLPVIASNVGGVPEAIKDGQTGILVEPEDPDGLGNAVTRLLDDVRSRVRMGESGRIWAGERFKADIMVNRLTEVYTSLLKKS